MYIYTCIAGSKFSAVTDERAGYNVVPVTIPCAESILLCPGDIVLRVEVVLNPLCCCMHVE